MDLAVDSNNDGQIYDSNGNISSDDDAIEEISPGHLMPVNDNDTNEDGDVDNGDGEWDAGDIAAKDVSRLVISFDDNGAGMSGDCILRIKPGAGSPLRIFDGGTHEVFLDYGEQHQDMLLRHLPNFPFPACKEFYIECVSPGRKAVTLSLLSEDGSRVIDSDTVIMTSADIYVTDVVDRYYADAESNVPVVFKINGPPVESASQINNERVIFTVDGVEKTFSGSQIAVYKGDLISEDFDQAENYATYFTAVIDATAFDPINVETAELRGITADVSYRVDCDVDYGVRTIACRGNKRDAVAFGDARIPVYEIGVPGPDNGTYDITDMPENTHMKEAVQTEKLRDSIAGWEDIDWSSGMAPQFDVYEIGFVESRSDGKSVMEIKYDTEGNFYTDGKLMKFILSDERRQGYVFIYYGRKTVSYKLSDGTEIIVPDLVDTDVTQTNIKYKAFTIADELGYFEWEYG